MLRLNLSRGPVWLDLVHDVQVEVLPFTTEMRLRASQSIIGPDGKMEPDGVTRDLSYTKAIAKAAIIGWKGVGDDTGAIAPLSPEGVDALLDIYDLYQAFHGGYVMPGLVAVAEGNVSAPSPNGTSVKANRTAARAKPPATTARSPSTRRKP